MKLSDIMKTAATSAGAGLAALGLVTMFNGASGDAGALMTIASAAAGMGLGLFSGYKLGEMIIPEAERRNGAAVVLTTVFGALLMATPAAVGGIQLTNYLCDETAEKEHAIYREQDKAVTPSPVKYIYS